MKKIQDTKTLEEFSLLYKNYKILNQQDLKLEQIVIYTFCNK